MTNKIKRVALIGTGIMGAPIAGHVLDAGFDLTVHNRTPEKARALVERGAHWASSPAEAARDADVVLTMVGYPSDVEDVYLASDGIIRASRKGAYLIDLSTSAAELARDIHDASEVEDKHAFDCPVTGGQAGAEAGTLTLFVGADEGTAAPVLPLLQCFSDKVFYFGRAGMGQTAKHCNQVSLASCMMGYAEAMALAEAAGLDERIMLEAVGSGMGGSVAMDMLAPKALAGDWKPGFMAEHLLKDLRLSLYEAEQMGISLPSTDTAFNLFDLLCQVDGSRLGTQALSLLYAEEEAGAAAGLDWSRAQPAHDEDGCDCEDGGCSCGHDHGDGECGCGHGDGHGHHHHE